MDGFTEAEAVAAIALGATYADGVMTQDEDDDLGVHLSRMKLFRDFDPQALHGMFRRLHDFAAREGESGLIEHAGAALPDHLKPTAFLVAADIILGDGDVGGEEKAFLDHLRDVLDVEQASADRILEVLEIKQRG